MAIPSSYMVSTKNLGSILEQIQKGRVPSKFTYEHLKQLGFPSSNDRPVIPVLKALGFLDPSGVPLERYRRYKDPRESGKVLAEGMREAYTDVFAIDEQAETLPTEEIKGIFARLSGKSDVVSDRMALTFRGLADHADFSSPQEEEPVPDEIPAGPPGADEAAPDEPRNESVTSPGTLTLRHDVHVHLPVSDDIKVYDAIFQSLREHILRR